MKRGEFPRPTRKMVNYSHMLVAALALTSFILLIKYRNATAKMSEDNMLHLISKSALEEDLKNEVQQRSKTAEQLSKTNGDVKDLTSRLQNSQDELSNTAKMLQKSYHQIEFLQQENNTKTEMVSQLRKENGDLQQQIKSLQESLTNAHDNIEKTKALADDNANTLKTAQDKQAQLLNDNHDMAVRLENLKTLQGENENLKNQLKAALEEVSLAKAKVTELENARSQQQENRMGAESVQAQGNDTQQGGEAQDAVKDEKEQKEENGANKTQTGNGTENMKEPKQESASHSSSANSIHTQNTGPSKTIGDSAKNTNISEELKHYDMLEDEVKEKVKKEMQANNNNDVAEGTEVDGQQEVKAVIAPPSGSKTGVEAKPDEGQPKVVENQEQKTEDEEEEEDYATGGGPDTADYGNEKDSAQGKKAFEESQNESWSLGMRNAEQSYINPSKGV